jgi:hypothetical protein
MTFQTYIEPLLRLLYPHEALIYRDYIKPNKRGTFSMRNAPEAWAKLGVSARYLYKMWGRLEALAKIYEVLVETGVSSGIVVYCLKICIG